MARVKLSFKKRGYDPHVLLVFASDFLANLLRFANKQLSESKQK